MNGPSRETQRLMERPRANRAKIAGDFSYQKINRPETLALLELI